MSTSSASILPVGTPLPANDNGPAGTFYVEVLLPMPFPITTVETEVFAALLQDWDTVAANDNEASDS